MPYGRGGAGNFQAAAAAAAATSASLEHTRDHAESARPITTASAPSGRGGAGNFHEAQPREEPSDVLASSNKAYRGRGGAGNLENASQTQAQQEADTLAQQQESIRLAAAKDVEHGLTRPAKVRLSGSSS